MPYTTIESGEGKHVKTWQPEGHPFEPAAIEQLKQCARVSVVHPYVAAMPDCHAGYGSTVGSVIPTRCAVIPAAVGVDIGCGMLFQPTNVRRSDLEHLPELLAKLNNAIPNGGPGLNGSWPENMPQRVRTKWMREFDTEYGVLVDEHPGIRSDLAMRQLGTLGTGNHFVELVENSVDGNVGILIHSGSRGLGNKIGSYFTRLAGELRKGESLPHRDLAYLRDDEPQYDSYMQCVRLAQRYAWESRLIMLNYAMVTLSVMTGQPVLEQAIRGAVPDGLRYHTPIVRVHCHHNYMATEEHFGETLNVTRKGAVRAGLGDLGIIPGSMGARTYVVEGLGNPDSFCSCSHGAGRLMSRTEAKKHFTVEQHAAATEGVCCDKSADTLDETPGCYKDIDAVMAAQTDLVRPLFTLKQFLCLKGKGEPKKWKTKTV